MMSQSHKIWESSQCWAQGSEAGPEVEQAWWRGRMARLTSVLEQLRSRPCRAVLAVAAAARCRPLKRWRELEAKAR